MSEIIQAIKDQKPSKFKELVHAGLAERLATKLDELTASMGKTFFSLQTESEDKKESKEKDEKDEKEDSTEDKKESKEKDEKDDSAEDE